VPRELGNKDIRQLINFLETVGALKRMPRTGWVDVRVKDAESVADHTFRTALLCMLYADIENLDALKLLRMALIHDLPEALIGDLTPSQKTGETRKREEEAAKQLLSLLPEKLRDNYLSVWREYQEGRTREAQAVRQLEKIEMALQANEYRKSGAAEKSLERFFKSAEENAVWPELKRLLSCISEDKQN